MSLAQQHPTLSAYGPLAWMLTWGDTVEFHTILRHLTAQLESRPPEFLSEYISGFQTLLLLFSEPVDSSHVLNWMSSLPLPQQSSNQARKHTIPVAYNGADLDTLAREKNMGTGELIELHSGTIYTVATLGFSPGFPYLFPLHPKLHTPRKTTPRPRIEAGSVAVGGSHTGIYSIASPGGWHILGRTEIVLFHPEACKGNPPVADDIFLLKAGDQVEFKPIQP